MKTGMKFASLALAGALFLAGCQSGGTYATVNGEKIDQQKYEQQLDFYKSMIAAQYQLPTTIKNSLIQEEVMRQDLKKNGVEITDKDYAVEYDKAVSNYGGAATYGKTLKSLGVTDEQMKESLHYQTISRKHKEWYNEKNKPSDEDINKYFNDHKAELITVDADHILVATQDEAKKVKERLDKGEDFAKVAQEISQDPGSKQNGGKLGEAPAAKYAPEFANAVSTLEVGKVSDPVKSQFGWHIIKVNSRKDSVDALKDQITAAINTEKYNAYVQELVAAAKVEIPSEASQASSEAASDASGAASDAGSESAAESQTSDAPATEKPAESSAK